MLSYAFRMMWKINKLKLAVPQVKEYKVIQEG